MEGALVPEAASRTHPADFFLPVGDRDATVELLLPQTRSSKRQRAQSAPPSAAAAAAAGLQAPPHIIGLQSSTFLLKSASPNFW